MEFKTGDRVKVISQPKDCGGCSGDCFVNEIGKIRDAHYEGTNNIYVYPFEKRTQGCSGFKAENLKLIKRRKIKKRKSTKKKKVKRIKTEYIKVSEEIHNKIVNSYKQWKIKLNKGKGYYPFCYMLGKNKNGIITETVNLSRDYYGDNCGNMITIDNNTLANAVIKLSNKKLIACGLMRVGEFNMSIRGGDRGNSLYQVGRMGGFILSYDGKKLIIEHPKKKLYYNVVEAK